MGFFDAIGGAFSAGFSKLGAAISSPSAQTLLKGALDVGVGIFAGGGLSNPNRGGSNPRLPTAPRGGGVAPPSWDAGRNFQTYGDFGGANMALLGAPIVAAAGRILPAIVGAARGVVRSPTVRAVGVGAAAGAAVDYLTGPTGMPRMRVPSRIYQMDQATGKQLSYAYEGTPVLYSRDLAVVRRVARVGKMIQKAFPGRSVGGRRARFR